MKWFKYIVGLLLLCVGAGCAESSAPEEGKMSVKRIMLAGDKGQKVCIQIFAFEMKEQRLTLDASAKETAELSNLDTNKSCKIYVGKDESQATVILRVEQNGTTFYTRPAASKKD